PVCRGDPGPLRSRGLRVQCRGARAHSQGRHRQHAERGTAPRAHFGVGFVRWSTRTYAVTCSTCASVSRAPPRGGIEIPLLVAEASSPFLIRVLIAVWEPSVCSHPCFPAFSCRVGPRMPSPALPWQVAQSPRPSNNR